MLDENVAKLLIKKINSNFNARHNYKNGAESCPKSMLLSPKSILTAKSFQQMIHMIKSPVIIFHLVILLQLVANSIWNRNE